MFYAKIVITRLQALEGQLCSTLTLPYIIMAYVKGKEKLGKLHLTFGAIK